MEKRAHEALVIGVGESTKGYKVYIPTERKVIITRHVRLVASTDTTVASVATDRGAETSGGQANDTHERPTPTVPRRSQRKRYKSRSQAEADGKLDSSEMRQSSGPLALAVMKTGGAAPGSEEKHDADLEPANHQETLISAASDGAPRSEEEHAADSEPASYREARMIAENRQWGAEEHEELTTLQANNTWTLVKCEPGEKRLHTKWVC